MAERNPDALAQIWAAIDELKLSGGGGGTSDYERLSNQPKINGVTLVGNKTAEELELQPKGDYLTSESDPTVPQWAKNPTKPSYTAAEVGADASGTAVTKVSEHNTAEDAHSDIRLLVQGLTDRLNTLADSDDDTLDQMSEIVAYIKSNKTLIDAITTSKVSVTDIVDNLTTNVANKPLSAAQGVALKSLIDGIVIPETLPNPQKLKFTGAVTAEYDGSTEQTVNIPESTGGDSYTLPIMSNTQLGGGKAVQKTSEDVPVAVDPETGQLFVPTYPSGGGSGQIVLLADLQADGESTEITYDVNIVDGLYAMGFVIPANTPDENKGQWLYLKFGGSGIFGSGLRAIGGASNVSISAVSSSAIVLVKDGKSWLLSDYIGNAAYNYDIGFVGIDVQNKVSLYSQSSKPVPTGVSAKLWRIL